MNARLTVLHSLRRWWSASLLAGAAVWLTVAGAAASATGAAELPPEYFPSSVAEPQDQAGWAQLANEFPRRVKRVRPRGAELNTPPATRVTVQEGVEYLRLRRIERDVRAISEALQAPRLILDLRYVRGDQAEAEALGRLLARRELRITAGNGDPVAVAPNPERKPTQVTLAVVNRGTSGALEAMLDALQAAGDLLLVGTPTAGDTGVFTRIGAAEDWQVILADWRRTNGPSLLDHGVAPALPVQTPEAADESAYLAFDAGTPLPSLLDAPVTKTRFDEASLQQQFDTQASGRRQTRRVRPLTDARDPEAEESVPANEPVARSSERVPFDRILQRAVNTLIALEALRRTPAGS